MEDFKDFQQSAYAYIETGKTPKLLDILTEFSKKIDDELLDELTLLKARQQRLDESLRKHTIRTADAKIEQAQIDHALMAWIKELSSSSIHVYPIIPPLKFSIFYIILKKYIWLIVASLVLVSLGILAWIPAPSMEVDIDVRTSGMGFQLFQKWEHQEIMQASEIYMNELKRATIPGQEELSQILDFSIEGEGVGISELSFPTKTNIDLELNEQGFHIYSLGESCEGILQIRNGIIYTSENEWEINQGDRQILIPFQTPNNEQMGEPIRMSFYQIDELKWLSLQINRLDFKAEANNGEFLSRILSGTIGQYGADTQTKLLEQDNLELDIKECHEMMIIKEDEALNVHFRGEVSKLYAGPKGFEKNYMPSLMEKLFEQHQTIIVAILIATLFLFILGIYRLQGGFKSFVLLISFGFIYTIQPSGIYAQNCDESLVPISDQTLKYQHRGNRCEGLYQSRVSFKSLKLVGLMKGRLQFNAVQNEEIYIKPVVKQLPIKPVYLRAQAIPIKTYYQMDASFKEGEFFTWPLKDVVYTKGLQARKLSALAYFSYQDELIYTPVLTAFNETSSDLKLDQKVIATFRASVDIDAVGFEWFQDNNSVLKGSFIRTIRSGSPIVVPSPEDHSGFMSLHIFVREKQYAKPEGGKEEPNWIQQIIIVYL